jgi:hypothetical protein
MSITAAADEGGDDNKDDEDEIGVNQAVSEGTNESGSKREASGSGGGDAKKQKTSAA